MDATLLLDHDALEPSDRTPARQVVRVLLRVTGEAPEEDDRPPLNLSLVLDRSGSMAGAKLKAARDAAVSLLRRLRADDVVSVVAYEDQVRTVAEPGSASDPAAGTEPGDVVRRVNAIRAGGCTNLSAGWLRGRELVERGIEERELEEEGVNRILLLTDGLANRGITDPESLRGLCRTAADEGITTTTIGFGEGYNEHLLRAMADAGRGNTWYIERPDQATDVFGEELEGLLGLAAQNLTLEIRPRASDLAVIHHSYPRTPTADGARLEMGDLYAREPKDALMEFAVSVPQAEDGEADEPVPVADLILSGVVIDAEGGVVRRELRLPVAVSPGEGPRVEPEIRRQIVLLEAAQAREDALEAWGRGDAEESASALREVARRARKVAEARPEAAAEAEGLRAEARELEALADRFENRVLDAADKKYLYQAAYDLKRSRVRAREVVRRERGEEGEEEKPS